MRVPPLPVRAIFTKPSGDGLMYQIIGLGMSNGQAASVIADGMRAYCPEKAGGLPPGV